MEPQYDPLQRIIEIRQDQRLWTHIDFITSGGLHHPVDEALVNFERAAKRIDQKCKEDIPCRNIGDVLMYPYNAASKAITQMEVQFKGLTGAVPQNLRDDLTKAAEHAAGLMSPGRFVVERDSIYSALDFARARREARTGVVMDRVITALTDASPTFPNG